MGAGIAASPHCAERRICQTSQSGPRGTLIRNSTHQLRRRFLPNRFLRRRSSTALPWCVARRLASVSTRPVWPSQSRSMFCGPSWDGHVRVPLRSPTIRRPPGAALRDRKTISSGASSRLAPKSPEGNLPIACRRRSDLWSPAASSIRFRLSDEAGTAVPITHAQCTSCPSRESEKCGGKPVDNGDIGQKPRNLS